MLKRVLNEVQSSICIEEHPAMDGLQGGKKALWLRMHRKEVLAYYNERGFEATLRRFRIKRQSTLETLLAGKDIDYTKLSKAEKALMKADIAIEAGMESKRRLNELEARVDEIEPMAQLGYSLLAAMRKALPAVEMVQRREREDALRLDNIVDSRGIETKKDRVYVMERR